MRAKNVSPPSGLNPYARLNIYRNRPAADDSRGGAYGFASLGLSPWLRSRGPGKDNPPDMQACQCRPPNAFKPLRGSSASLRPYG